MPNKGVCQQALQRWALLLAQLGPTYDLGTKSEKLMTEMTHAGKYHRHAVLVRSGDNFFIAH